jgi:tetratricopeptide (TPR) repeat protein
MYLKHIATGLLCALALTAAPSPPPATFSKDVLPILQKNCQGCHRPGEAAPFSLLNYEQARPWAKAIKEAVLLRKMPPWFADPHFGRFANDPSLSQKDIQTLAAWTDSGAPEGDPKDAPAAINFIEGWRIPKPDVVIEVPNPVRVPASGTIEYQHVIVPSGITQDRWIQFAEARPGNAALVHHIVVFIREPGSKWLKDAKPGVPFVQGAEKHKTGEEGPLGEVLVGYAPGLPPTQLQPGQAILVKAGSDIVFQLHYTANGKAGTDQSRLGLVFATEAPKQRVYSIPAFNDKFKIPAGDANYQVESEFELGTQVELTSMQPHMHSRGKDFEYRAVYPTGESEVLLRVPNYSFSWQLAYYLAKPIVLPKGTRIQCVAHFDNSANNRNNPDPRKNVSWGDQSWDEMMIGFFSVAFDANMPLKNLFPGQSEADQIRPKSQKELEALRAVQAAKNPGEQIQAIDHVLARFPDTAYKFILLENAMKIELAGGDFARMASYGERLLAVDPQNVFGLVTMAIETARHTRDADLVDKYARAGLDAAKVMPKPAGMTDVRWEAAKKYFEGQAYEAMGQAAALRKRYQEAIADYKQAIAMAPGTDAGTWIELGEAYENSGMLDDAEAAFDKALATPNLSAQNKTVAQSKKDEVAKRKGG